MGHFFDETQIGGSLLLLALAIADHSDASGRSWPGYDLLSSKVRGADGTPISPRQIKRLVAQLEDLGHVDVVRSAGRGHKTEFQLKKVTSATPFTAVKGDTMMSPITEAEKVTPEPPFTDEKRCHTAPEKVTSTRAREEEPFEPKEKKREEDTPLPARSKKKQERQKTRPDLEDAEFLDHLATLDENRGIDIVALYARMLDWCDEKRVTPTRLRLLKWLEGERADMPVTYSPPVSNRRPFDPGRSSVPIDTVEAPPMPELLPQRPPANVPIEQRHMWDAFRDAIKAGVHPDIFESWFKALIFDGLDVENSRFKVRARRVAKDWITLYYAEKIYDAFGAIGAGEFTIEWEVEEEIYEEIAA